MNDNQSTQKKLVLLVDDSEEDTFLLKHAAKQVREDIDVRSHLHAANSLQELQLEAEAPETRLPDLIFIDINMPSMNGMDFLKNLKATERLKCIPAIMFSTSGYQKDIDYCYCHGAGGYLLKPSGNKELVNRLEQVFNYWIDSVEPAS